MKQKLLVPLFTIALTACSHVSNHDLTDYDALKEGEKIATIGVARNNSVLNL